MAIGGRERGAVFLGISIMGALGVGIALTSFMSRIAMREKPQQADEKIQVVVAKKNIAPGWTIAPEMLETRTMERRYVPPEALLSPEEVTGRVALDRVLFGEFIRSERLAQPEAGVGLTAIIPRGMRAYQVQVSTFQQLSGFLNPGNFVDVIAVCEDATPPEARTLLRSVSVLAVNDRMIDRSYEEEQAAGTKKQKGKKVKPSVTLALTPDDTVILKAAVAECEVHMALRNEIDITHVESNDPNAPPAIEVEAVGPAEEPTLAAPDGEIPATEVPADPANPAGPAPAEPPVAP